MKVLFLSDFVPKPEVTLDNSFKILCHQADYIVFNLEGSPLTETQKDNPNQLMPFHTKDLLDFIKIFGKKKFRIALANNHILDNGKVGFEFLEKRLIEEDVEYFGTIKKPFTTINNTLSILNFVTAETVAQYSNRKKLNYLFYNPAKINKQIKELEELDHQLVLYPHWGRDMDKTIFNTYSFEYDPLKWTILGHHPHIISGIREKWIYSLGNTFIPHPYYYEKYPATRYGLAVMYDTSNRSYSLKQTEVHLKKQNKFILSVSDFVNLPQSVVKSGNENGFLKKTFLKFFSFSGNFTDFFKLCFLQMMILVFQLKIKIKK